MEENKYPIIEEEDGYGCMSAAEPAVVYAANGFGTSGMTCVDDDAVKIDQIPTGRFGFFTDTPEVLEQRVAEIEADLDEVDAGIEDQGKWISSERMRSELYKKHPWLK